MTNDEMIRRLQTQFGDIGGINAHTLTGEERSNRMDEGTYNTYGLGNPALMRQTEFGEGLSNVRPGTFGPNTDPRATEYGIIPSKQTATPTSYWADLTAPAESDKGYGYYTAEFSPEGKMTGTPQWAKAEKHRGWLNEHAEEVMAAAFIAATLGAGAFGSAGLGAADLAAASGMAGLEGAGALGAGIGAGAGVGGMTAAEAAAAYAAAAEAGAGVGALGAGTGAGTAGLTLAESLAGTGISEAALAELGFNTGLTAAEAVSATQAASALTTPWYEPFAQGFQSIKDVTDVGKFIDGPSWLQQGATSGFRNVLGQVALTGDVDFKRALQAAATAGITDFANPYFAELPKELQSVAKAGVQTALQGGDIEDVVKSAAFETLSGNVTKAITGTTGSKWAGELASNAIKQALTSGNIDSRNFTANTLAQLAGRAVGAETGNEYLGRAATTAVLGAIKGKDLEDIVKQMAMGALTTPTKKG